MKTWLKRTLAGVAASTALLGAVAAWSQDAGFHHGPPTPEQVAQHEAAMLAHIGRKLSLDATQAAKLKVLGDLLVAQRTPPAAGTPDPHVALIAGNTFDRAGATQLMNQHIAKIQAAGPSIINAFGDFFDSLNATQQAQLREMAAHHHGLMAFGLGGPEGLHGHHGPHDAPEPAGN